jgi:hypothetical protein
MPAKSQPTMADLMARIDALEALNASAPKAKAPKASAPKASAPRAKAAHGEKVTEKDLARYSKLWRERLDLRNELRLVGWVDDEASTDTRMMKVVKAMAALRTKGVTQYLVKPDPKASK